MLFVRIASKECVILSICRSSCDDGQVLCKARNPGHSFLGGSSFTLTADANFFADEKLYDNSVETEVFIDGLFSGSREGDDAVTGKNSIVMPRLTINGQSVIDETYQTVWSLLISGLKGAKLAHIAVATSGERHSPVATNSGPPVLSVDEVNLNDTVAIKTVGHPDWAI